MVVDNCKANMPRDSDFRNEDEGSFDDVQSQLTASSSPPEPLRNDYQHARRRNLHAWSQWRTQCTEKIVDFTIRGNTEAATDSSRLEDVLSEHATYRDDPTNTKTMLMSYSGSIGSNTSLNLSKFLRFGIPRAKLTPNLRLPVQRAKSLMDIGVDPSEFGQLSDRSCVSDSDYWREYRSHYIFEDVVTDSIDRDVDKLLGNSDRGRRDINPKGIMKESKELLRNKKSPPPKKGRKECDTNSEPLPTMLPRRASVVTFRV
ncbi:hypothetical protein CAPTEDRAFT_228750 [Capitella teleta]|uniref:Uncharacterized protein n=1 Tax=Capitella teleta TaxID=283909 RepID=R7TNU9_CAPTE|nr:hypothetical protein CAPTEDRAFT_228750 [Capitella teleta]|eukprot:ELT95563.1 hypothetical protein CAPTEDRAFT_228750 [Capitella teleta]